MAVVDLVTKTNGPAPIGTHPTDTDISFAEDWNELKKGLVDQTKEVAPRAVRLFIYSDGTRPAAASVPEGTIIYNSDDWTLNIRAFQSDGVTEAWVDLTGAET